MLSKPYTKLLTILFLFILCSVPHTVLADDYRITADHILTAYYGPGGDIVLPKEVLVVGVSAFMNNKTITSVVIQEGCHTIQDGAFDSCSNMTGISLPSTLEEIGRFAFARCTNLKSCYLPSNITRILDGAFRECHALTTIEIPERTEIIGSGCFCYCDSINKFRVNKNNTHFTAYEDALFTSDMKTLIQYPCGSDSESYFVPKGVEVIGRNAFTHALSLREITLPDTITKLKSYAFSSCTNITEIELPSSLSFIADNAFKNASNLCRIYVHNDNVEIFPEAFIGDYSLIIYGNHSSTSETYAQRYNIPFSVFEEGDTIYPRPQKNCLLT